MPGAAALEELADADQDALQRVEDIGPKVAASLAHAPQPRGPRAPSLRGCATTGSTSTCSTTTCRRRSPSYAPLAAKTVVVTGAIADPRSGEKVARPVFQRLCERAGATTASSVSASTDLLICGANVGASKTAKAQKLGVQVVGQAECREQLIGARIA